jgi:ribosomal protein S18 acetylase RimI-like enzyme
MTTITTRRATLADLPAVAALFDAYRQFYAREPDATLARRYIEERLTRGESIVLVAEAVPGELLGFTQLYPTFCSVAAAPIFVLYDLFVAAHSRRMGVGCALLLAAEAHARAQGAVRMDLSTARTNRAAQALYESLGWVRDDAFVVYNRRIAN